MTTDKKKGHLIGYARVSTKDQDPARQIKELEAAGCTRVFTDHGVSGTRTSRPQFDRMLDHLRPGDTLVVTELSRLGRTVRQFVILADDLTSQGLFLRSLTQGIDTGAGSTGKLLLSLFAALAEIEREVLVERTHSGLAAARAQGRVGGRPVALSQAQAVEAQRMIDAGSTITHVAAIFGVGRASVRRAFERLAGEGRIFELEGTAVEVNFSKGVSVRCEVWLRIGEASPEVALVEPADLMGRDDAYPWTISEAAHLAWGLLHERALPGSPPARLQWVTHFEEGY